MQTPPQNTTHPQCKTFDYGIKMTPLNDGQIIYFTNDGNVTREAVDYWWTVFSEMVQSWPKDQPILFINDFSHPNIAFTPYVRNIMLQACDLLEASGHDVKASMIVKDSFTIHLVSILVKQLTEKCKHVEGRVHDCFESAMDWLHELA